MNWTRRFPNSANNFDLLPTDPQELDSERMKALLESVLNVNHRGLTLSSRASKELRRFFDNPDTALKSEAYVLLSNWFMTQSGDRHSTVATRCEDLWDALFSSRPTERLSSPEAGRNHVMVPAEFENFWRRLLSAQGGEVRTETVGPVLHQPVAQVHSPHFKVSKADNGSTSEQLRARFDKDGLHCEVEGSATALADFLKIVSNWEAD